MKIDQEEFNRKAEHIIETVVKPQVARYEKAKAIEKAAEKWVFETNGHVWSNNDDTAGDNFGSFIAGAKWQQEQQRITLSYFRKVYKDFLDEKITMSKMIELLNNPN